MTAVGRRTRILLTAGVLAVALAGPASGQTADLEGTLVIVNKGASTVSIVDVGSGTEVAVLPTGTGPHEVAITADGRTAVITDYGAREPGNSLTIVDVAAQKVRKTIDVPSGETWGNQLFSVSSVMRSGSLPSGFIRQICIVPERTELK